MKVSKPQKKSEVVRERDSAIIRHHQTLKLSKSYNSLEIGYGVEFRVNNTRADIEVGLRKAEKIVEDALAKKHNDQKGLLKDLAGRED